MTDLDQQNQEASEALAKQFDKEEEDAYREVQMLEN